MANTYSDEFAQNFQWPVHGSTTGYPGAAFGDFPPESAADPGFDSKWESTWDVASTLQPGDGGLDQQNFASEFYEAPESGIDYLGEPGSDQGPESGPGALALGPGFQQPHQPMRGERFHEPVTPQWGSNDPMGLSEPQHGHDPSGMFGSYLSKIGRPPALESMTPPISHGTPFVSEFGHHMLQESYRGFDERASLEPEYPQYPVQRQMQQQQQQHGRHIQSPDYNQQQRHGFSHHMAPRGSVSPSDLQPTHRRPSYVSYQQPAPSFDTNHTGQETPAHEYMSFNYNSGPYDSDNNGSSAWPPAPEPQHQSHLPANTQSPLPSWSTPMQGSRGRKSSVSSITRRSSVKSSARAANSRTFRESTKGLRNHKLKNQVLKTGSQDDQSEQMRASRMTADPDRLKTHRRSASTTRFLNVVEPIEVKLTKGSPEAHSPVPRAPSGLSNELASAYHENEGMRMGVSGTDTGADQQQWRDTSLGYDGDFSDLLGGMPSPKSSAPMPALYRVDSVPQESTGFSFDMERVISHDLYTTPETEEEDFGSPLHRASISGPPLSVKRISRDYLDTLPIASRVRSLDPTATLSEGDDEDEEEESSDEEEPSSSNSSSPDSGSQSKTKALKEGKKSKRGKPLVCPVCKKVFKRDLTRHIRTHEEVARFICPFPRDQCSHKRGQFNRPYDFKKHLLHYHFEFDKAKMVLRFRDLLSKLDFSGRCLCGKSFVARDWLENHILGPDPCPLLASA